MENYSIKKNRIKVYFVLLFVALGSLMIFSFGKVLYKDRGSQQSTSAVYGSKPSNVKTSTLLIMVAGVVVFLIIRDAVEHV